MRRAVHRHVRAHPRQTRYSSRMTLSVQVPERQRRTSAEGISYDGLGTRRPRCEFVRIDARYSENLPSAMPIASSRPHVRELTGEEVAHAPLGVVHRTPRHPAADEANMSPAPHKLYFER
jgi:hypothetical protein